MDFTPSDTLWVFFLSLFFFNIKYDTDVLNYQIFFSITFLIFFSHYVSFFFIFFFSLSIQRYNVVYEHGTEEESEKNIKGVDGKEMNS